MNGFLIKDLAEMAGISYDYLHDIDAGLPEGEKLLVQNEGEAKYDPVIFVQRWVKYKLQKQSEELALRSDQNKKNKYAMTARDLAALAGYSYQYMHQLDSELPENAKLFKKNEDGSKYDLAFFVRQYAKYNYDKGANADAGSKSLDEVRAEHEQIKKEKTALQVQKMRGELVELRDVKNLLANLGYAQRQHLEQVPASAAPRLLMLDNAETISAILGEEIRNAMLSFDTSGITDAVVTETDEEEEYASDE